MRSRPRDKSIKVQNNACPNGGAASPRKSAFRGSRAKVSADLVGFVTANEAIAFRCSAFYGCENVCFSNSRFVAQCFAAAHGERRRAAEWNFCER